MRLFKSFVLSIVMLALFVSSSVTSFGQTKDAQQTKGGGDTPTCVCEPIKKTAKKSNRTRRNKKRQPAAKPPVRIVYLPAATPPVTATAADFSDMVVNAGEEGRQSGSITLSSGNTAEDAGTYLNAAPGPNLQAWFNGLELHVFSPNGGNGRVNITDKNGKVLDTLVVTGNPPATTITDSNIAAMAQSIAAISSTLNSLWWFILIGFAIVIILLILIFVRLGWLSIINENIVGLYNRLRATNDTLTTVASNTADMRNELAVVMEHFNIRRREQVIEAELVDDEDPNRQEVAG